MRFFCNRLCGSRLNHNCDMETFGYRVRAARKTRGMTQTQLAAASGLSQTTISDIERGRNASSADIVALARALDVRAEWLADGRGPRSLSSFSDEANVAPAYAMKGRVPLISSVQAGMWTEIIDNFQPGDAEAWVECHRDLGPHGYALRVKGESMTAPTGEYSFPHGMILYVNPSAEPLPGKFVVVRRNGHEATFKRLTLVDGEMYLEAINPDWPNRYIKLTPDDHICGVVVYAGLELP